MNPPDLQSLPAPARRLVDPASPLPMRTMAARGVVPGLRPADIATVVAILTTDADEAIASTAQGTLANLADPILQGALSADLDAWVIAQLCDAYIERTDVMTRLLQMPRIAPETVESVAAFCNEAIAEIVATNEERLLEHPGIIERLWLNKRTRMSTADRVLELAARNNVPLTGIPQYDQIVAIVHNQPLPPGQELAKTDVLFKETLELGAELSAEALANDSHERDDDSGEEKIKKKFVPLYARIGGMSIAQKIRLAMLGSAAERALLMRETNRLVCTAAIRSPLVQEPEVVRISASRVVSDEVLRIIANSKDWTKNPETRFNLVSNPRTPLALSAKLVNLLRDHELKSLAKSKGVPGAIAKMCKQMLERRNPAKKSSSH